jgi:hypothetical protein
MPAIFGHIQNYLGINRCYARKKVATHSEIQDCPGVEEGK